MDPEKLKQSATTDEQRRYCTWEEAEVGHREMVALATDAEVAPLVVAMEVPS